MENFNSLNKTEQFNFNAACERIDEFVGSGFLIGAIAAVVAFLAAIAIYLFEVLISLKFFKLLGPWSYLVGAVIGGVGLVEGVKEYLVKFKNKPILFFGCLIGLEVAFMGAILLAFNSMVLSFALQGYEVAQTIFFNVFTWSMPVLVVSLFIVFLGGSTRKLVGGLAGAFTIFVGTLLARSFIMFISISNIDAIDGVTYLGVHSGLALVIEVLIIYVVNAFNEDIYKNKSVFLVAFGVGLVKVLARLTAGALSVFVISFISETIMAILGESALRSLDELGVVSIAIVIALALLLAIAIVLAIALVGGLAGAIFGFTLGGAEPKTNQSYDRPARDM